MRVSLTGPAEVPGPTPGERPGLRWWELAVLTAWTTWWARRSWDPSGLSWHYFATGGHALFHGSGLAVFVDEPTLQVGPLTLLVAAGFDAIPAGRQVAQVLMTAAGPLLLLALAPLTTGRARGWRLLAAAAILAPAWCVLAVRWAHLDDVLAMVGGVMALRAVALNRSFPTMLWLAAAIGAKPWAVGFAPIVLGLTHARLRVLLGAAVLSVASWAPFIVAEPRTLEALRPPVPLIPGSGLHTLGVRGRFVPAWGRSVELVGALLAGLVTGLLGRWPGILVAAVAVRLALDPQDNPYYIGSAVLAAAAFDLVGTSWRVPWTTVVTSVALWQPFVATYDERLSTTSGVAHWWFENPQAVGWIHLTWAAVVLALVLLTPPAQRSR
jgi:hypothetical protein